MIEKLDLLAGALLVGAEAFAVSATALWPFAAAYGAVGRLAEVAASAAIGLAAGLLLARHALSLKPERLEDE
ncbi:hypothetical protein [Amphiplicatus metriothermophilus]|uniref:Uncharacterized protein n=1 Tax=Amphiplicatus metriothermophilus TaxID=1519374 RepID=A0A239PIV9_9PROT|nr:hypothetical protein [Amphiplicatus metriothermophilus]MBB5518099.1 hypothetical protein [Amphiplicatus metriothermophilus]SNT67567.1 hypothetical protein SAMN06297382_0057 [Amphiplicatus metriothermophilus]